MPINVSQIPTTEIPIGAPICPVKRINAERMHPPITILDDQGVLTPEGWKVTVKIGTATFLAKIIRTRGNPHRCIFVHLNGDAGKKIGQPLFIRLN